MAAKSTSSLRCQMAQKFKITRPPEHLRSGGLAMPDYLLSVSCLTDWLRPVAAQPDAMPTAAAFNQSCAGKSLTPTVHATTPSTSPAAPQMVGIHLSATPGALTAMPIRYATAVIAATDAMPSSMHSPPVPLFPMRKRAQMCNKSLKRMDFPSCT